MCHGETVGSPEIPREASNGCDDALKLCKGIVAVEIHPGEIIYVTENALEPLEGFGVTRECPGFTEGVLEWLKGIKVGPTGFQA